MNNSPTTEMEKCLSTVKHCHCKINVITESNMYSCHIATLYIYEVFVYKSILTWSNIMKLNDTANVINCKCIYMAMLNKGRTSSLILTICKCSSFSNMIYYLEIKLSSNNKYNFLSSILLSKTNPQRVSWVLYGFYTYSAIRSQCRKSF